MTAGLYALFALLGYNVLVALVYGYDKLQAKRGRRRVRERTLLCLALVLGALGAWGGMRLARHKTHKRPFTWVVPLLLVLQIAGLSAGAWALHRGWFRLS